MIPRLVVASKNPNKVREIEDVVRSMNLAREIVRDVEWDDVEETGETLVDNALLKARSVVESVGLPALADDTGLEVDALGGAPGVRTARFAGPDATYSDNVAHLLTALEGQVDRTASFKTVVALVMPDGVEVVAEGFVEGQITLSPRGDRGFGYDPVFEVGTTTMAEMSPDEKNDLSHRARALRALGESLGL